MKAVPSISLNQAQRHEVARWIEQNQSALPEAVRLFLVPHQKYLAAGGDLRRAFDEAYRELRRALGITPSSERRGRSARANSYGTTAKDKKARLEQRLARSDRLGDWHQGLHKQHAQRAAKIQQKLAEMEPCSMSESTSGPPPSQAAEKAYDEQMTEITIDTPVEAIELTEAQQAECKAAGRQLAEHLSQSYGEVDPALQSVEETLMPSGTVVNIDHIEELVVQMPEELADATVVKKLSDTPVRYDIVLSLNRIELNVPKHVVVTGDGRRTVVSASTDAYGPPRYSVTWSALATLAVLVGQFALPLNRIATLFSATGKTFNAGGLSRLLHYVAMRLAPLYLQLSEQLADSEILSGDDTSCRVVEVSSYLSASKTNGSDSPAPKPPPWAPYRTPAAAQKSITACEQRRNDRQKRRAAGDRNAKPTADEEPSLAMLLGRALQFESPLVSGGGSKQSMNTTVVTGRSDPADPRSLIVLYRSHLGGYANLLESILQNRNPSAEDLIVQADLSQTNQIRDPQLLKRFKVRYVGCSAHARRPFAQNEDEDPLYCPHMLHLFEGLAMHEQQLDEWGRNRDNVLAVRQADSRRIWGYIKDLATTMTQKWSKGTKLGTAARYIINHYDELTAYLDDPRLEPTNNMRERMLRTEKLIESSSMFRRSLEGRFALDIIRTVLQTAIAADVPVHQYLQAVLRTDPQKLASHPEQFTPRAWAQAQGDAQASA